MSVIILPHVWLAAALEMSRSMFSNSCQQWILPGKIPPRGLCSHTDGTLRESVCWLFILARSPEGKCSQTHKSHKATRNRCFLKSSFPTMTWHQAAGEHDSDTPSLDTGESNEGAGQTMRRKTGRKSGSKTGSVDLTTWNMSMTGTLTDFSKYDSLIETGSAWWDHSLKQDVLYEFLNKIYINKILTWQKKAREEWRKPYRQDLQKNKTKCRTWDKRWDGQNETKTGNTTLVRSAKFCRSVANAGCLWADRVVGLHVHSSPPSKSLQCNNQY